ncbi:depupylase/deamidase Dop [Demequina zhanjiangensis]|uniref:Depupylase/deamidase Dop n=1 Tax=Demequina zhanjiangensis TaxID=3051659 RepID=A0ABT8G1W8_9MICO|nr:depupylase/deamidase Dop [Demequina sp. SYSU T00b26]MDN4473128.1 depupylase/deamidase Dop [Demequina sp. SYSU T00b26]
MRIVGLETEYGIADPDRPGANPILMSSRLVSACRDALGGLTARWDYGGEDPLQDQRGMRRERRYATGDMLTDSPEYDDAARGVTLRRRRGSWEDPAHLNAVLPNGARFYVDHAHPEYSGPEVRTARDAVTWDAAGDAIALRAAQRYAEIEDERVTLYKNNVDGKGASYGTHENYLIDRDVDFDALAALLIPHLVTRQIYTGSGRVGLGTHGETPGFQLSQRADYMETEVGLETTLRRPIVNTRDEPHATRKRWRRLHLIIGDANCLEVPTLLKLGTTSLVLAAIEAGDERLEMLELAEPVEDVRTVSRDLDLTARLRLRSGEDATALEIQRALLEIARTYATDVNDADVIARWEGVLDRLGRDIFEAAREVEWVAKLQLLGRMRVKNAAPDGTLLSWDDPRLAAMDLQWSRLGDGLAWRLAAAGAVERLTTDDEVAAAAAQAPSNTRARLRGAVVVARADIVDAAGWSTVVIDREARHGNLEVIHLDDPHEASHALLDSLMGG